MKLGRHIRWWMCITALVIGWRLALTGIVFFAQQLPYSPTFPFDPIAFPQYGSRLLTTWAQFDGVHYLTIITKGYVGTGLIQAFFPLYPLIVRFLTSIFGNPIWVGIVFSTCCFGVGLCVLYRLVLLDESTTVAKRAVLLILLAPTAFYFTALYTEGLFFMLLVLCFYLARKEKWWVAGFVGILLSATRVIGIAIVPALFFEYWHQQRQRGMKNGLAFLLPIIGIGSYVYYLRQAFGDPFLFYHVQGSFGAQRETTRIILIFQVFYRYIKMFLTIPIRQRLFYVVTQEFLAGLFGFVGLLLGWFYTRRSYVLFSALAYLTPTLTGTLSSMPRYVLPLFPLYIVAAKLLPKWAYITTLIISMVMLIINLIIFTQGLWVA